LKKSDWNIESYRNAIKTYLHPDNKDQKQEMERLINDIKGNIRTEISSNDPNIEKRNQKIAELRHLRDQKSLFAESKAEAKNRQKKQEELEQIEYHQNLAKAAEAERLEIEKKRKNEQKTAKDKLASDFQLLGKVIGLTPDKFRKAESLLSKGQIEELIAFVVHEEISFNELILSVQSKIQSNTEIVSFKAGKGTYFEVTRMIRKEWLWWRNVVNILRDYESIGNLTKVKHDLTDIYRKDSADVESPDYLTTELISKFLTLQALVLYKLGEKKQAKKCMKSSDKQNWDSLYLKYKKECRSAKAASLIFYQDLCTAMYL
jgi:hypothetical protein